jgi:hypothetical protein
LTQAAAAEMLKLTTQDLRAHARAACPGCRWTGSCDSWCC